MKVQSIKRIQPMAATPIKMGFGTKVLDFYGGYLMASTAYHMAISMPLEMAIRIELQTLAT